MTVITNLRGTSETEFRIGVTGPTIYTGTDDPTVTPPTAIDTLNNGDIYLRNGGTGGTWVFDGADWAVNLTTDTTGNVEGPNLISNGSVFTTDGSATTPTYSFTSDPDTGMYLRAADQIGIATNGVERVFISDIAISSSTSVSRLGAGSAVAPTYSFSGDPTTGFYNVGTGIIGGSVGGTNVITIQNGGGTNASVLINSADAIQLPAGIDAERPSSATAGMIRYNTFSNQFEGNVGGTWQDFTTGGAGDMLSVNNLSDLQDLSIARTNLGLVAGGVGDIWVERGGDTMTGTLNMGGNILSNVSEPVLGDQVGDVDFNDGRYMSLTGSTMTGPLDVGNQTLVNVADPTIGTQVGDRDFNDARYVSVTGDTLTGNLNVGGNILSNVSDPTLGNEVGDRDFNDARYVNTDGDSMTGTLTMGANIEPTLATTFDVGTASLPWQTFFGESTSALYADLAEKYEADADYPLGTVLVLGGDKEVTTSTKTADTRVVGIVSKRPAVMMNNGPGTEDWPFLALAGRVPVRVVGRIDRGDRLATSHMAGVATSVDQGWESPAGCVIGIAMEAYDNDRDEGLIEMVVRSA